MLDKAIRIAKYILYIILTNITFVLLLYYVFSWLVGHSLLYAYLGNLTLIALGLWADTFALRQMQSEAFVAEARKSRLSRAIVENFVSFKAILYLSYTFILVIAQMINLDSTSLGDDVEHFILANEYSILVLIALDGAYGQFRRDRDKAGKISAKIRRQE
ncbi:MAG: hypothetical protein FWD18_10275 [Micrococcales bacterium]|nr:hypothetical protein [Micrococcales bacterium]